MTEIQAPENVFRTITVSASHFEIEFIGNGYILISDDDGIFESVQLNSRQAEAVGKFLIDAAREKGMNGIGCDREGEP